MTIPPPPGEPHGNDGEERNPLLPVRHPNQDLFICDILDAVPKDDMASMEHPVFSLSTKPDTRTRRYEHNGNIIEIIPSGQGLATIHDKDVLIYCISQLVAKINQGIAPNRTVRLRAYDMLVATNRQTSGAGYKLLNDALVRLRGTTIRTNIETGGVEETRIFGLIEEAKVTRKTFDGRMVDIEITLSDWVYRSVISQNVLTLHRDYFRLRKPFERRLYELARKHCGTQEDWKISLDVLQKKCGSNSTRRVFRALVKKVCDHDAAHSHFPDYAVSMREDVIYFKRRNDSSTAAAPVMETGSLPYIDTKTMEQAKKTAPGYDVYSLYNEWAAWWVETGRPELKSPAAAFLGFCKKRHQDKPQQRGFEY